MSEELKEFIEELKLKYKDSEGTIRRLNAIEDGFKKLEEYDKTTFLISGGRMNNKTPVADKIAKQLKALEIIKKKMVIPTYIVNTENVKEYNKWLKGITFRKDWLKRVLTQEEYDLLKEELL